jgi:hypothetical protein
VTSDGATFPSSRGSPASAGRGADGSSRGGAGRAGVVLERREGGGGSVSPRSSRTSGCFSSPSRAWGSSGSAMKRTARSISRPAGMRDSGWPEDTSAATPQRSSRAATRRPRREIGGDEGAGLARRLQRLAHHQGEGRGGVLLGADGDHREATPDPEAIGSADCSRKASARMAPDHGAPVVGGVGGRRASLISRCRARPRASATGFQSGVGTTAAHRLAFQPARSAAATGRSADAVRCRPAWPRPPDRARGPARAGPHSPRCLRPRRPARRRRRGRTRSNRRR